MAEATTRDLLNKSECSVNAVSDSDVVVHLKEALRHMFDFTDNYRLAGVVFPLYAKYFRRNSKYFAVKKAEIYAFSNYEHLFYYRLPDVLDETTLTDFIDLLKANAAEIVQPDHEHMSSVITLILDTNGCTPDAERAVRRFRYRRNFKFGFQGWADIKIIALNTAHCTYTAVESRIAEGDARRLKLVGEG